MKIVLDVEDIVSAMNISREAFDRWKAADMTEHRNGFGSLREAVFPVSLNEYQSAVCWTVQPE